MSPTVRVKPVQVNREEILRNFRIYFQQVEEGETIVVLEAGKPVAEIRPLSIPGPRLRPFGLCAGEFQVPDDFDAPFTRTSIRETTIPPARRLECPVR